MAILGGNRATAITTIVMIAIAPHVSASDLSNAPTEAVVVLHPQDRASRQPQVVELVVPVRERGPLGQVSVLLGPDNLVRVRGSDLVPLLSRMITPEAAQALTATADSDGFITPEAARTVGFELTFDTGLLDLAVVIPLDARRRQSLTLGFDSEQFSPPVTDEPAPVAAYLNYRASLDYLHKATGAREQGFQAPRFDLEFMGTVGKIAFENYATVDPDADRSFQRNASRLIFDQPEKALRWTAGDLVPEGASFQSASDIAGVSVARLYSLTGGDRLAVTRSSRTITIREPSTVEIRINGLTARTLTLSPGTYDLRDLPLTQGANAVELVIEGPSGAREIISFDFFSDTTLLAPGVDEFYLSAGIRAPRQDGRIEYLEDDPVVSGFYRRGISEQITVGGNIQATKDAALIGAEALYGSIWGLTAFDLAVSRRDQGGSGFALRGQHRAYRELRTSPGRESLDVSLEYRSENFSSIENLGPALNYAFLGAVRYSRPLNPRLTASLGVDYAHGRGSLENRYGVSAFGTWRTDFETNVTFGATYNSAGLQGEETNLFVNLTRRFGARSTVSARAETRNGLVQAGYSRAPERTIDDWALSIDASRTNSDFGVNGSAVYIANRGEFEINHASVFDESGDVSNQQTSLRAYGALAYVGGRFGIGRRIYDSFALVSGHRSLEGRPVLIRGASALEESARSGLLGPALTPLGSYFPQSVPYDVSDLPVGYDLGSGLFQLQPRLHSGYSLTVGSAYNVSASGVMLDDQGRPVSLRIARAVSLDDPTAPKAEVITNRTGRFAITGLSPGRWRITLAGQPALIYDIVVPDTTLFRAGEIRPTEMAGVSR